MTTPVQYESEGAVTVIRLDDGKANAVSHEVIAGISDALDAAEQTSGAVAVLGRPDRFSAGFDLSVMSQGPTEAWALVSSGARLLIRMLESPLPIVAGCTGHALAMGALILMASDTRIGAAGDFKIGLNEVSIGMALPSFGVRLAEGRLSRRHLPSAVMLAEIYTPQGAVDAGFLDRVVAADRLENDTLAEAARLAEYSSAAFATTKRRLRDGLVSAMIVALETDHEEWEFGSK